MSGFGIKVDSSGLDRLREYADRLSNVQLRDLQEGIGAEVESQTKRRIAEEKESPDGAPWAEWSDVHAATRHAGQSLLQGEGDLLDSIQYEISGGEIRVGSPLVYAGVMQHGAKRGEFGRSSRGPIPWGDIPSREYLGLSIENEDDLLDLVEDYIEHEVTPL